MIHVQGFVFKFCTRPNGQSFVDLDLLGYCNTVGGRNPAPVGMVNVPLFEGFIHPRWLAGFLPSTVPAWVKS